MPRVLIVEDNELNRDMLSRRLTRRGFEVLLATDGAQGVEAARAHRPDLILMDMSLPVVDGWEATRRIKAAPETGAIPIIALTAHAMAGDEAKARAAGCDDFDTKPVELPRLLEKMARWLAKPSATTAAGGAATQAPSGSEAMPVGHTARIERPATAEYLGEFLSFVTEQCDRAALPADVAGDVRLAAEEACANVIDHAYANVAPGPLALAITYDAARVVVTIEDRAPRFDPRLAPAPDLETSAEARALGGLGWHLIRRTMDAVVHEYFEGRGNRLTLTRQLPPSTAL